MNKANPIFKNLVFNLSNNIMRPIAITYVVLIGLYLPINNMQQTASKLLLEGSINEETNIINNENNC